MTKLIVGTIVVAIGVVAASCLYVVDQTEYAIQMRFGKPIRSCIDPGLYFKAPWPIDTVVRFDNRLMVLENPAPGGPDREYLTEDVQSGIGKNVVVTTYTCWRIKRKPEAVLRFLETMGDRPSAEARLGDVVNSELGVALGRNDFSALVSTDAKQRHWSELIDDVRQKCADRVEKAYGIEIADVQIERLNFPEQNRRNVFDRMRAERQTIAAQYRSEGDEKATTIRAQANRQRDEIVAKAVESAERIRGKGDAEAARIYADAYSKDPKFYEFQRTLEAYEKTLTQGTVAILSGNSEWLKLLNQGAESEQDIEAPLTKDIQPGAAAPATLPAPKEPPS